MVFVWQDRGWPQPRVTRNGWSSWTFRFVKRWAPLRGIAVAGVGLLVHCLSTFMTFLIKISTDLYEMAVSYPLKWYHQGLFVCVTAMIFRVLHRELYHKCGSYLNYVWPVYMRSPTFFQNSIMGVGVFGRAFFSKRKLNLDVLSCN